MKNNTSYIIKQCLLTALGIWFILSGSKFLYAQKNEISFKHITTKEGLLDDVVLSIEQDAKGYMWFGTRAGLVRYDGISFQNFTNNPDEADGLSGNSIVGLHIDGSGTLWIGTINGLCRFDEKRDRPVNVLIKINDKIIYPSIQGITSSRTGLIWLATLDHGLISFDPLSKKSTQFLHDENDHGSILSNRIFKVFCSSDDNIWIGTNNGLNSYDQQNNSFTAYKHEKRNPNTISGDVIQTIAEGKNGDIWVGTINSGLNKINPKTGQITIFKHEPNNKNSLSDNFISAILYNDDKIWIGSGRGFESLNTLDIETGLIKRYKITGNNEVVYSSSTRDILMDRTGIIWIAYGLNGVKYFDNNWDNYKHYVINDNDAENLLNRVYGINPISNTTIWGSTFDGLILFDIEKGLLKWIQDKGDKMLLNGNSIFVKDELWVPSRPKGIFRYNLKTGDLGYLSHQSKNNQSLSSNYINVLLKDSQGIVWVGSRDGGLDRIDTQTEIVKRYNHIPGNNQSLPDNSIYALLEKSENELWVGTNGGLALFDKTHETFKNYSYDPKDSSSISSNQVSYILKSKNGILWVGSYGGGLNKFDLTRKTFRRYTSQRKNLPNNTVYSLIEDDHNNLWVSTAKGLARFSPATETYDYIIPIPDNYKVNKFPNGNFCFSGPRGILVFDPNKIKFNTSPPAISLAHFSTNKENASAKNADSLLYVIKTEREIELDYSQNDLKFEFTIAHYSGASKNKLSVFLDGYDHNWRSLGSVRSINYTNLDPGKYILKAKGASAFGVWTGEPISFAILIHPPWWKTWWAYSIYALTLLGFLYTIRKFELNRQRKNSEIKEGILRAEAAELQAKAAESQNRLIQAENERKSKELEEARELQLSMLPRSLPQLPHLDIAVYMKTATEVGGDYYDFHVGTDGELTVVIGDATGHGMQAGTMVTAVKGLFNSYASKADILYSFQEMSRCIKELNLGKLSMCMTMLKIQGDQLRMSSAGMPPSLIFRNDLQLVEEHLMQGVPLGTMNQFHYKIADTTLNPGDTILLLSDGLPEQQNLKEEMYGYDRIRKGFKAVAGKSPEEIISFLKSEGKAWNGDQAPDDDVTFVVIKAR